MGFLDFLKPRMGSQMVTPGVPGGGIPSGVPQNLPPSPGTLARGPGLGQMGRELDPMGRFENMFRTGVGGSGMGADPAEAAGGGMFGDMSPLEKMFLITSGVGAAADIGTGIYDRMKEARQEREEKDRRDIAGRRLSAALAGPYSRKGYHGS
ncbi:MAG: hypothetical protein OXH66_14360 [Gemmatimonadetes bacterium]|nr:hypothetical protein [Gemmatimonadota bacterium]